MALCEACKGIDPERAWGMRMDVALMLLTARTRLIERSNRQGQAAGPGAGAGAGAGGERVRADGKREVRITSFKGLVSAAKQLQSRKT